MTNESLADQIGREFIDAFNRRDTTRLVALCDRDVEFRPTKLTGARRTYHGHDGIREWGRELVESGAQHLAGVREIRVLDDERFVVLTEVVHDGEVLMPSAMIARLAKGKLIEVRGYLTDIATLEGLGFLD